MYVSLSGYETSIRGSWWVRKRRKARPPLVRTRTLSQPHSRGAYLEVCLVQGRLTVGGSVLEGQRHTLQAWSKGGTWTAQRERQCTKYLPGELPGTCSSAATHTCILA